MPVIIMEMSARKTALTNRCITFEQLRIVINKIRLLTGKKRPLETGPFTLRLVLILEIVAALVVHDDIEAGDLFFLVNAQTANGLDDH